MSPKVSVIVPCYNVEKYLNRCVNALVSQTLSDIEIILVDDGSLDGVPRMCDSWAAKDPRIKVIHKKNAGLGFARNSGLDVATGEYIAFVDGDDYIDCNAYEDAFNEAVHNDADIVLWGIIKEIRLNVWKKISEKQKKILESRAIISYMLDMIASAPYVKHERLVDMAVWHGIYKRKMIDSCRIRFLSERDIVCEDIPFDVDILLNSKKMVLLEKPYSYYCLNENSLSSTFKVEKFEKFIRLHELLKYKLLSVNKAEFRVDRFFIGFTRSYILNLCKSNTENKREVLKKVVRHPIWDDLMNRFKPSFLPLYPRVHLWLLYKKKVGLLILFSYFVLFFKKGR